MKFNPLQEGDAMARNKYPGVCYRCKNVVKKGEGHFEKIKDGWRVQHVECCLKAKVISNR